MPTAALLLGSVGLFLGQWSDARLDLPLVGEPIAAPLLVPPTLAMIAGYALLDPWSGLSESASRYTVGFRLRLVAFTASLVLIAAIPACYGEGGIGIAYSTFFLFAAVCLSVVVAGRAYWAIAAACSLLYLTVTMPNGSSVRIQHFVDPDGIAFGVASILTSAGAMLGYASIGPRLQHISDNRA